MTSTIHATTPSKPLSLRAALIGSIAAVAILSIMQLLVFPVLEQFVEFDSTALGLYEFIRTSKAQFFIIVVMGWLVGAFYEEIVFHGFIFTRLERMIPGKYATAPGFVLLASCLVPITFKWALQARSTRLWSGSSARACFCVSNGTCGHQSCVMACTTP